MDGIGWDGIQVGFPSTPRHFPKYGKKTCRKEKMMFADNKVDLRTIRVFDITLSLLVLAVEPSLVRLPKRGSIEKQRQSCVIIVDIKTEGWLALLSCACIDLSTPVGTRCCWDHIKWWQQIHFAIWTNTFCDLNSKSLNTFYNITLHFILMKRKQQCSWNTMCVFMSCLLDNV